MRVVLAFAACAACAPDLASGFACEEDAQCGTDGRCEPTGACSFPDDQLTCASQRRYGSLSVPGLASTCVPMCQHLDPYDDFQICPSPACTAMVVAPHTLIATIAGPGPGESTAFGKRKLGAIGTRPVYVTAQLGLDGTVGAGEAIYLVRSRFNDSPTETQEVWALYAAATNRLHVVAYGSGGNNFDVQLPASVPADGSLLAVEISATLDAISVRIAGGTTTLPGLTGLPAGQSTLDIGIEHYDGNGTGGPRRATIRAVGWSWLDWVTTCP